MPQPLTLYGSATCDDTERTREHLQQLGIDFHEVVIDDDAELEAFVRVINGGYRSTPTLVFGDGQRKMVVTEPDAQALEQALADAGHVWSA